MPNLGAKLRELRQRRQLSIREVASRSGISHSAVSLIERDRMSPSVDTLSAILDALGTTLTAFFLDLRSTLFHEPFYRAPDLVEIGNPEAISHRVIGINYPNRQLLLLHERYEVGADSGQAYSHTAQEAGMVVRGKIRLTVDGTSQILGAGDGYYFDSRLPHRFVNAADERSEIVSAITPPTY
jgi:transcriptional regulator with XRE-family HTH domain